MNKNEYELIIELYEFLMTNIDSFFESPGLFKTKIKTENPNDAFIFGKILVMFNSLPENLKNKVIAYNL